MDKQEENMNVTIIISTGRAQNVLFFMAGTILLLVSPLT